MPDERNRVRVDVLGQLRTRDEARSARPRSWPRADLAVMGALAAIVILGIASALYARLQDGPVPVRRVPVESAAPAAVVPPPPSAVPEPFPPGVPAEVTIDEPAPRAQPRPRERPRPVRARPVPAERSVAGAPAPIEPYRNGTVATRLTGEALRRALVEDSRLTRELNQASLRDLGARREE